MSQTYFSGSSKNFQKFSGKYFFWKLTSLTLNDHSYVDGLVLQWECTTLLLMGLYCDGKWPFYFDGLVNLQEVSIQSFVTRGNRTLYTHCVVGLLYVFVDWTVLSYDFGSVWLNIVQWASTRRTCCNDWRCCDAQYKYVRCKEWTKVFFVLQCSIGKGIRSCWHSTQSEEAKYLF